MQIKIIKKWKYYKQFYRCDNLYSQEPSDYIKYNEIELIEGETYWVNPDKNLIWNTVE